MELSQIEVDCVEGAVAESQNRVRELSELQLAMIGGGCGETIAV